jgi:hypothetical protein
MVGLCGKKNASLPAVKGAHACGHMIIFYVRVQNTSAPVEDALIWIRVGQFKNIPVNNMRRFPRRVAAGFLSSRSRCIQRIQATYWTAWTLAACPD